VIRYGDLVFRVEDAYLDLGLLGGGEWRGPPDLEFATCIADEIASTDVAVLVAGGYLGATGAIAWGVLAGTGVVDAKVLVLLQLRGRAEHLTDGSLRILGGGCCVGGGRWLC
jgi:hypothetical protein